MSDIYEKTVQITRDHPDYHSICDILRQYPDLIADQSQGVDGTAWAKHDKPFIRVPDEQAWMVYPEAGKPYLEVEVFALASDRRAILIDFNEGEALTDPVRRQIYID